MRERLLYQRHSSLTSEKDIFDKVCICHTNYEKFLPILTPYLPLKQRDRLEYFTQSIFDRMIANILVKRSHIEKESDHSSGGLGISIL